MLHTIVFYGLIAAAAVAWIQILRDIRIDLAER